MPKNVTPGNNVPEEIHVYLEIIGNKAPTVKYELDKESGVLFVDRFFRTSFVYPCHYGFIPNTLGKDGDPVDVLLYCTEDLFPGVVVPCRPIGVFLMEDESGMDEKIIAVPTVKIAPAYGNIHSLEDLPPLFAEKVEHFFANYKALDKGKWVKAGGFADAAKAKEIILQGVADFRG